MYKVTFKIKGKERIIHFQRKCGLGDIRNGFWVCADHDQCPASKSRYFVVPHEIILIERV